MLVVDVTSTSKELLMNMLRGLERRFGWDDSKNCTTFNKESAQESKLYMNRNTIIFRGRDMIGRREAREKAEST